MTVHRRWNGPAKRVNRNEDESRRGDHADGEHAASGARSWCCGRRVAPAATSRTIARSTTRRGEACRSARTMPRSRRSVPAPKNAPVRSMFVRAAATRRPAAAAADAMAVNEPGDRGARARSSQSIIRPKVASQQAALRQPRQTAKGPPDAQDRHGAGASRTGREGTRRDVKGQRGRADRARPAAAQAGHHRGAVSDGAHECPERFRRARAADLRLQTDAAREAA